MNETHGAPTELDLLKYAVATTLYGASHLLGAVSTTRDIGTEMRATMTAILKELRAEVAATLGSMDGDVDWFSSGRPVYTDTEFPDCDCNHFWVWHPDPRHERNRPKEIAVLDCPRGGQHRLVVVGPGELESVDQATPDAR